MLTKSELQQIKKSVSFMFTPGGQGLAPRGTGFFVGLPLENPAEAPVALRDSRQVVHLYFVTARHILQDGSGRFLDNVAVRVNRIDGRSDLGNILLNPGEVFTHKESEVDLAVIPVSIDPRIYDVVVIQEELLATKEKIEQLQIGEGDEVFFVGLFTHHFGKERNQPIVRFGRVALIPDEKVQSGPNTFEELYLMECQSFSANSGSPAFFYISLTRHPVFMQQRLFLAGVIKGHFRFPTDEVSVDPYDRPNMGIAAVIPAFKLHEILHTTEMRDLRLEIEKRSFKA